MRRGGILDTILAIVIAGVLIGLAPPLAAAPLFVACRGEQTAAPLVILESGAFGTSADWADVLKALGEGGRACAFDRAGLGRSPGPPGHVTAIGRGEEIGALLDQLGWRGRVILVGHSNGGLYVEAYARLHPERVAGLVYINAVGSEDLAFPRLLESLRQERRLSNLAVTLGRMGLSRLVADVLAGGETLAGPAQSRKRQGLERLGALIVARDEDRAMLPGLCAVARLPPLPRDIPVVAVFGDLDPSLPLPRDWSAAEREPAEQANHGWVLDAANATHTSPLTRDRAYLEAAIDWLRSSYPTS